MNIGYLASELAKEHRRDLLREVGADREDLLRHRLELHRSGATSSPRPMDPLLPLLRRLPRPLIGWLVLIAIVACGTVGWAGTGLSSDRIRSGWHVAPVDCSPEAFSYPEDSRASDPIANTAPVASDYPPQERDIPELLSLLIRNPGLGLERAQDRRQTWSGDDLAYPGDPVASPPELVDDKCLWHSCSAGTAEPQNAEPTTEGAAISQRGRCTADGSNCLVP